jgi:hypothetical protein
MSAIAIEQAIYGNPERGGFRFLARSPGFVDDWLPLAEKMSSGFGDRPAGLACPGCVFAQPFGPRHIAVVQAADLGSDDADRPGALGFRFLVLSRRDYTDLTGDPFLLAERFPPNWSARGDLPALSWPHDSPPGRRTVAQVQAALQNGDSPTLLGGAQALIDAGRLVFERPAPATDLLRRLWILLPVSSRAHLWPASFAFGNALKFDVLVVPRADPENYADYIREEQAGDYPEGRYELALQIAAEAGDQRELDALFARRSSTQMLRLALVLLTVMAVLAVVMNLWTTSPRPSTAGKRQAVTSPASGKVADQPALGDYPPLSDDARRQLSQALRELIRSKDLGATPEAASVDDLLTLVRARLLAPETPEAVRQRLQKIPSTDPPEKQLRGWLWALGVEGYNDPRLNVVELVERLQQKLPVPNPIPRD